MKRRGHGQSVYRAVAVEDSKGQVTQGDRRFVVVHSRQLAQQQTHTDAVAPAKAAAAVTAPVPPVQARWFAGEADATAASAA
jgi:hypothetical protein